MEILRPYHRAMGLMLTEEEDFVILWTVEREGAREIARFSSVAATPESIRQEADRWAEDDKDKDLAWDIGQEEQA